MPDKRRVTFHIPLSDPNYDLGSGHYWMQYGFVAVMNTIKSSYASLAGSNHTHIVPDH